MNIRKPTDYSGMFRVLDTLMAAALPQMDLYCEIGRLVNSRPEKGAAVAASEYLRGVNPGLSGFSPRNLRRMREFVRNYESEPEVLAQAMGIGWTQNVVILEAELTLRERAWYIRAVHQFGWSKAELIRNIHGCAHEKTRLDNRDNPCYSNSTKKNRDFFGTERQDLQSAAAQWKSLRLGTCGAYMESLQNLPFSAADEDNGASVLGMSAVPPLYCNNSCERLPLEAKNEQENDQGIDSNADVSDFLGGESRPWHSEKAGRRQYRPKGSYLLEGIRFQHSKRIDGRGPD